MSLESINQCECDMICFSCGMLAKPKISSRRDFKEQYFLYFLSFNATWPELTSSTIHNETKWFKQLKFENCFERLDGIS